MVKFGSHFDIKIDQCVWIAAICKLLEKHDIWIIITSCDPFTRPCDPYLSIIARSNMRGRDASSSIALVPVICMVSMSALRSGVMGWWKRRGIISKMSGLRRKLTTISLYGTVRWISNEQYSNIFSHTLRLLWWRSYWGWWSFFEIIITIFI